MPVIENEEEARRGEKKVKPRWLQDWFKEEKAKRKEGRRKEQRKGRREVGREEERVKL
jgi:hypothetical protein